MKKTTFIINPSAGFGRTGKKLKSIIKEIEAQDKSAEVVLTRHPLHAMSLAKEAIRNGSTRLIVIGGDGTLNEVINGYFDANGKALNDNVAIGIIPSGTGSDFVRSLNHPRELSQAIAFALTAEDKPTDIGLVEARDANGKKVKRYFINVSSVGLSGIVAGFMKTITRRFGAKIAYFLSTVQAIRAFDPPTLSIKSSGHERVIEKCSLLSFANGKFFGSGMKIAPDAKLDDGQFDVITLQDVSPIFFVVNGHHIYAGTHLTLNNVSHARDHECTVTARTKHPVYVETDGELFAELPAKYTICHNALRFIR